MNAVFIAVCKDGLGNIVKYCKIRFLHTRSIFWQFQLIDWCSSVTIIIPLFILSLCESFSA